MPEPIPKTPDRDLARRRAQMFATLGFNERFGCRMDASFRALRSWLNSWRGIGDIEAGCGARGTTCTVSLRWPRLAGDVLRDGDGAQHDRHHRFGI